MFELKSLTGKSVRLSLDNLTTIFIYHQSVLDLSIHDKNFNKENLYRTLAHAFEELFPDSYRGRNHDAIKRAIIRQFKQHHKFSYGYTERQFWLYMDRMTDREFRECIRGIIIQNFVEPAPPFEVGTTVIVDRKKAKGIGICDNVQNYIRSKWGTSNEPRPELGKVDQHPTDGRVWIMFADRSLEAFDPSDVRKESC